MQVWRHNGWVAITIALLPLAMLATADASEEKEEKC
jgi:hypothetical protein